MYNCLNKFKIIFIIWLIFLPLGCSVFWDDLSDNIYSTFKRQFDWWSKDSFLETPYSSNFPKDPYVESFDDIEDMSRQLKIAWTEYIEKVMAENGCSLSKKKIWSILYQFVPEFRSDLVQTMKIGLGEYASKNFTFDRNKIINYCKEYYACMKGVEGNEAMYEEINNSCAWLNDAYGQCLLSCTKNRNNCVESCTTEYRTTKDYNSYSKCTKTCESEKNSCNKNCKSKQKEYEECLKQKKKELKPEYEKMTTDTPANVETNCKEFFV